jgi:hypothetical protein
MSEQIVETSRPSGRMIPALFTTTIFLSASLLFFVQPLFAKIALPVIGGAPAVWTTAMLFFQTVLIGGYAYAYLSTHFLPVRAQIGVHVALWAVALFFLPPALPEGWRLDAASSVPFQTLWLFALGVGAPFALLSSNAPLIQSWYSRSGGPSAHDPYFLYGASNLGSLLALLAFPLLAEPLFGASEIAVGFATGFIALGVGLSLCGATVFGKQGAVDLGHEPPATPAPRFREMGWWLALAFVPSSLMLAVTSKISLDIGALPLVWVIPLALYLLSFVLSFTHRTLFSNKWMGQAALIAIAVAVCLFMGVAGTHLSMALAAALIGCFFIVAIWAHRQLYESRPDARHLALFYVTMSLGGALGGLFNSIVAPIAFNELHEGAVTLGVALLLVFAPKIHVSRAAILRGAIVGLPLGMATVLVAPMALQVPFGLYGAMAVAVGIATLILRRPFAAWITSVAIIAVLPVAFSGASDVHFADRSFFGVHKVVNQGDVRYYSNGTTIHGAQWIAELDAERPTPTSYYHRAGPMGQVMSSPPGQRAKRIGIVGLGVGSLACYARPGQDWHFYEIDSMVDRVARDPDLFTFLSACTPDAPTHLGDARVVLQDQADIRFDILVIDAYSSDAVPIHLTTLEAMQLYLDRLTDDGVLIFHISNRYYQIERPLARSAERLGVTIWQQFAGMEASDEPGYRASQVAMIARNPEVLAEIGGGAWQPLHSDGGPVWTDDRANALSILKVGAFR